jgi:hypothetical protein
MNKQETIKTIKQIISDWGGSITDAEMGLTSSPIVNQVSKDHFSLVESYHLDYVGVTTYVHGIVTDETDMSYEDLSEDTLDEIWGICVDYEESMLKTMDKCRDENF